MAKFTLNIKEEIEFKLLAISCRNKMYKFAWDINKLMDFELIKHQDFLEKEKFSLFKHYNTYKYLNNKTEIVYLLIENKGKLVSHRNNEFTLENDTQHFLVQEFKQFDYLLYINGLYLSSDYKMFLRELKAISNILTVTEIELDKIKNKYFFTNYDPFK